VKSFSVPIFGSRIYHTRDRDEAQRWLDKNCPDACLSVDGLCANNGGAVLVYTKDDAPGLLAHEAVHAAGFVLDACGAETRDEEIVAHLVQFIVDKAKD
jgi:hypothetical protein